MPATKVCIIGAGIIGLTSAVCIQESLPDIQVTILADKFSPENTSDVAAGLIEPYLCPPSDEEQILKWCETTIKYLQFYMKEVPNGGTQEMSGYLFQRDHYKMPFWWRIMKNFRRLTPIEMERHPLPQKAGFFYTTYYLEPTKHIAYLLNKFHINGGKLLKKKIEKLSEIGKHWDIVVNCTGIAAKFLVNDEDLIPVRGQIIRARAPHIKHFFIDDDFHVLLNDDCVIMGGTREINNWDLAIHQETIQRILKGNAQNIPALKDVEVISHHVGIRPYRSKVRLEMEYMDFEERKMPVIHNYGHGGSGVTLSYGCALDVASLVKKELSQLSKL